MKDFLIFGVIFCAVGTNFHYWGRKSPKCRKPLRAHALVNILEAPAFMLALLRAFFSRTLSFSQNLASVLAKRCSVFHSRIWAACVWNTKLYLHLQLERNPVNPAEITWGGGRGGSKWSSWSVSSGFVYWLWWIIRVGRYVYKNLCLFLLTSSQAPSGWTDTFRCLQRCLGSDWSKRGPSQLSLNHFCDGAVQTMGGQAFYPGGASVGVLRLVEVCNGDGPSGGFPHLHTGSPPAWGLGPWARLFLIPSWRARYE